MFKNLYSYTRLIRLPNSLTLLSDIMLGMLLTNIWNLSNYLILCLISFFCYNFGMILNDINDIKIDQNKQKRPLVNKTITIAQAYTLLILHLCPPIIAIFFLPIKASVTILLLIIFILMYNSRKIRTHHKIFAFCLMALCRIFNIYLGSSFGEISHIFSAFIAFSNEFLLIFIICAIAYYEDSEKDLPKLLALSSIFYTLYPMLLVIVYTHRIAFIFIIPLIINIYITKKLLKVQGENIAPLIGQSIHLKVLIQMSIILSFVYIYFQSYWQWIAVYCFFILNFLLIKKINKFYYSS